MQKEGFIRGFKKIVINDKKLILVLLKYTSLQTPLIRRIERVSKPGQRIFSRTQTL
jgi:ribosomal protein S8